MLLRIGQPQEAWEAFEHIDELQRAPAEGVRVEVLRLKAYTPCVLSHMVQSCIYLEAAFKVAHYMQSEPGVDELYTLYEHMLARWDQEQCVRALAKLFQQS